jgi:aminoglycoside phosphotransferase family enzyme
MVSLNDCSGCFGKIYLKKTGDSEILEVVQPFYAWRALVVASPIWYPI